MAAAKLLPYDDLLGRINAVTLKHVLGDIQTDAVICMPNAPRRDSRQRTP
jgi:hypothetical protein